MLLLPSAFPCEGPTATARRPGRPSLASFSIFTNLKQQESSIRDPETLSTSRALNTILGNPVRSPRPATKSTKPQLRNPFDTNSRVTKSHNSRTGLPRGMKKRNRDEFEADLLNTHYGASTSELPPDTDVMSTPKRRRRIPLDMPLGLSAVDFESLEPTQSTEDIYNDLNMPELLRDCTFDSDEDVDSGYGTSNRPSFDANAGSDPLWTIDDDRILVETVLEKLQLSKRAWSDCARKLGKSKDSIGQRWQLLVDEGEVGLKVRRGGNIRRPLMEVAGW